MTSETSSVACQISDGVARTTLNRPPVNVMNIAMMRELNSALEDIQSRDDVKLLVIDHECKAFSAGVDIKDHTADKVAEMIEVFHQVFRLLGSLTIPTVALVDGAALGGGCELATFCDIVFASERATFGQPEIKVGVFPPVAAVLLPHLVGRNRTLELLLTGEIIDATQAAQIGLINRVFPVEDFREKAAERVAKLAAGSSPVLRLTKQAVDQGLYMRVDEAISKVEELYINELMQTNDAHEGLTAFMEKRIPQWTNS